MTERWRDGLSLTLYNPVFSLKASSKTFQKNFLLHLIKQSQERPAIVLLHPVILFEQEGKSIAGHVWQMAQIMFPKTGEDTTRGRNTMTRYMTSAVSKKSKQGNKRLGSLCAEWISTVCMLMQMKRWKSWGEGWWGDCVYSLVPTTLLHTHIRGDPSAVFDRVALDGDVVDLSVRVGEDKMLPS